MKKFLLIFLSAVMLFNVCACSDVSADDILVLKDSTADESTGLDEAYIVITWHNEDMQSIVHKDVYKDRESACAALDTLSETQEDFDKYNFGIEKNIVTYSEYDISAYSSFSQDEMKEMFSNNDDWKIVDADEVPQT